LFADSNADWIQHGVLRQELVYASEMEQTLQPRRRGVAVCEWHETVQFLPTKDNFTVKKDDPINKSLCSVWNQTQHKNTECENCAAI
jgi:hypothetical protein